VNDSASIALHFSSLPTCGPITSRLWICAPALTDLSATSILALIFLLSCSPPGGRRIATSREEPKFCTCGSWKPAAVTAARMASTLAVLGKMAWTVTPPVKSIARFSPRTTNEPSEISMNAIDSPYHTLRVAMNGKLVAL